MLYLFCPKRSQARSGLDSDMADLGLRRITDPTVLPAPGGDLTYVGRFLSEHLLGSSPSSFRFLQTPLTLLASVTFCENQSLPMLFPM